MKRKELTKTYNNDDFKLKKTFGLYGLYKLQVFKG